MNHDHFTHLIYTEDDLLCVEGPYDKRLNKGLKEIGTLGFDDFNKRWMFTNNADKYTQIIELFMDLGISFVKDTTNYYGLTRPDGRKIIYSESKNELHIFLPYKINIRDEFKTLQETNGGYWNWRENYFVFGIYDSNIKDLVDFIEKYDYEVIDYEINKEKQEGSYVY